MDPLVILGLVMRTLRYVFFWDPPRGLSSRSVPLRSNPSIQGPRMAGQGVECWGAACQTLVAVKDFMLLKLP